VGKTLSARSYAAADDYDYWFAHRYHRDSAVPASLVDSPTLMYTPDLTITARRLNLEVGLHVHHLSHDIERALNPGYDPEFDGEESECRTELVIIDEADRLRTTGLEQLRDFFDRHDLGLILIGMPLLWPYAWVAFASMCLAIGVALVAQRSLASVAGRQRA